MTKMVAKDTTLSRPNWQNWRSQKVGPTKKLGLRTVDLFHISFKFWKRYSRTADKKRRNRCWKKQYSQKWRNLGLVNYQGRKYLGSWGIRLNLYTSHILLKLKAKKTHFRFVINSPFPECLKINSFKFNDWINFPYMKRWTFHFYFRVSLDNIFLLFLNKEFLFFGFFCAEGLDPPLATIC